ncbi:MAG: VOC family protein, partial [Candidatus Eremiobacteraeota bacterium]|nr:VOC family protein [Candidatus Eremiobacteraeota bacterium]
MVTLVCADLGRSREFYRNVMGLTAIADRSPDWIEFDLGAGAALRLHPKSELLRV